MPRVGGGVSDEIQRTSGTSHGLCGLWSAEVWTLLLARLLQGAEGIGRHRQAHPFFSKQEHQHSWKKQLVVMMTFAVSHRSMDSNARAACGMCCRSWTRHARPVLSRRPLGIGRDNDGLEWFLFWSFGRGSTLMGSHVGVGALPILLDVSGDWDVHWGYGVPTHGHFYHLLRRICVIL